MTLLPFSDELTKPRLSLRQLTWLCRSPGFEHPAKQILKAIALEKDSQYSLVDAMLVSILDPLFDVGVCEILPEALKGSGFSLPPKELLHQDFCGSSEAIESFVHKVRELSGQQRVLMDCCEDPFWGEQHTRVVVGWMKQAVGRLRFSDSGWAISIVTEREETQ
ncbi:MAG: hypothetical protein AAGA67_14055 [Cyanobacteria bacterium P01_F01_bin.153]